MNKKAYIKPEDYITDYHMLPYMQEINSPTDRGGDTEEGGDDVTVGDGVKARDIDYGNIW